MRILFVHAFYQRPGGEDRVVRFEAAQMAERGHEVAWVTFHNDEMRGWSPARTATRLVWNGQAYSDVTEAVTRFRPDVVHVQNVFPGLSPSVYWAAERAGVPVVQKLSNYRLFCVNGVLFRDGAVCEDCLGKSVAWPGIRHGCYRGSRTMSAGVALSFGVQRALGTWDRRVTLYVALDEDGRSRFVRAGLDPDRIAVKPEAVEIPPEPGTGQGGYALFAGRLSAEKGIEPLLEAWTRHEMPLPLVIAGDGPAADRVREAAAGSDRITWLGHLEPDQLERKMAEATLVVVPSTWYEMFGRTAAEAMAHGTPVVASRIGALQNVVREGISGRLFTPGDAADLARAVREVASEPRPGELRARTREDAIARFSPEVDYARQVALYETAMARAR